MRKSTLFVSAMLTVFLMVTMFGVVSAYQQVVANTGKTAAQSSPQVLSQSMSSFFLPVPATELVSPLVVTPEEATTIAVDFLGDPNVFSVEVVDYEGAPTFLVTFSSGDLIYVNSIGVVVANTKIQPVVVAASSGGNGGGSQATNNNGGSSGGEDDHDEDHDDDHDD